MLPFFQVMSFMELTNGTRRLIFHFGKFSVFFLLLLFLENGFNCKLETFAPTLQTTKCSQQKLLGTGEKKRHQQLILKLHVPVTEL
jgi:hypothetical protein